MITLKQEKPTNPNADHDHDKKKNGHAKFHISNPFFFPPKSTDSCAGTSARQAPGSEEIISMKIIKQQNTKNRHCSFPHSDGASRDTPGYTGKPQNEHLARDFHEFSHFDTFSNVRHCSFPHSYCASRAQPETQHHTHASIKTSISCETSTNFHTLTHSQT